MGSIHSIGAYSVPEAARMIGMPPKTLHRWVRGYEHGGPGEERRTELPLWATQYDPFDEEGTLLGFRDLVEARIVHALRRSFGLQTLRICIERARNIVNDSHPFSTARFRTDGKSLFLEITEGLDEPQLIDLKRRQGVFRAVVEPSLTGLDFGPDGAERWWLLPGKKTIVADPDYRFGQPIIAGIGIPTCRVVEAVKAEGSIDKVARLYEIAPRLVRDALDYEHQAGLKKAA